MPVHDIFLSPLLSGHPYLDPGSGSMLLQLILAALLGGAFAIKVFWKKIVSLFKRDSVDSPTEQSETGEGNEE